MNNHYRMGWKRDLPDQRDFAYRMHREYQSVPAALPSSVDLRSECPPIKDQGQIGSCVWNATGLALEFIQLRALKNCIPPQPDIKACAPDPEVFQPSYTPLSRLFGYYNSRALDGDIPMDNGTHIRTAIKTLRKQGICEEALWPYEPKNLFILPEKGAYDQAQNHKILSGYRLDVDLHQVKSCLASGFPFVFGVAVYTSFMSVDHSGVVPMPRRTESLIGGHAVMAVGYLSESNQFIVANSWGTHFGDSGYIYLPFNYLLTLGSDFWTIRQELTK